jgi:acylphosphatase
MTINCPACDGEIEVGDDMLGEGLACPHCEHVFLLTVDGEIAEYVAETAGGGGKKGIIIGASVLGVAVVAGLAMLLSSGGKPPAKSALKPVEKPVLQASETPSEGADLAPPPGMPQPDAEPQEALPPVEIPETPDGTIVAVSQALADGNPRGVWDALPASYQTDVSGLIKSYAETTDPVMWDKGFSIAGRLAGVLGDKKEFIFNSPMMAANPKKAEAEKNWSAIVGVLNTVLNSDIGKRDKLMSLDVGQFLGTTGAELLADFESLAKLAPTNQWAEGVAKLRGLTAKVVNTTDGVAEVEVSSPGETNKVEKFVQIENRWIPQKMALDWENMMTSARTNLAAAKQQQQQMTLQGMMIMGMVEGVLTQFENANSQEEFDKAAQGVFGMMAGMAGGAPGGAPPGFEAPPMKQ